MANDWVAQYWRASEFDCSCCKTGGADMDPTLIAVLDECRKRLGVRMVCNSGYRCPAYNSSPSIGSGSGSYHPKHMAADVTFARRGLRDRLNILRLFVEVENIGRQYGGLGIGIYPSFVHIDSRTFGFGSVESVPPARWSTFNWSRLV